MTIEQLEIGKWYTIGGGDSNMKCIYIAHNYAVFLSVSEVHYTVNTEFMPRKEIEEWGNKMYEQNNDYLDECVQEAIVPKYKNEYHEHYEDYATFREM